MSIAALSQMGYSSDFIPGVGVSPNMALKFSDYHLSYNPSYANYGSDTTALVLKDRVFLILNGDHSKALADHARDSGIDGCIRYFAQNIHQANKCSEHLMVTGHAKDVFALRDTVLQAVGQAGLDLLTQAVQDLSLS